MTPQVFALFFVHIFAFFNFFRKNLRKKTKIIHGSYMTHPPSGQRPISLEQPAIDTLVTGMSRVNWI